MTGRLTNLIERSFDASNNKIESLQRKVDKYEELLHAIQGAQVACDSVAVKQYLSNIFVWSHAHRTGNGAFTDEEQEAEVKRAFDNLTRRRE